MEVAGVVGGCRLVFRLVFGDRVVGEVCGRLMTSSGASRRESRGRSVVVG